MQIHLIRFRSLLLDSSIYVVMHEILVDCQCTHMETGSRFIDRNFVRIPYVNMNHHRDNISKDILVCVSCDIRLDKAR